MPENAREQWVGGVDGCRGGWLLVAFPAGAPQRAVAVGYSRFADILAHRPALVCIAVDIPIGLPERSGAGGRAADAEARANLGGRQSSLFAVPSRRAVFESDYRRACAAALETSDPPRKVAKQTFNLFAKIREVDAAMTPKLQDCVVECHPELAFWALNGERPLDEPKKVKSRPYEPGLALRRSLLARCGFHDDLLEARSLQRSWRAGPDDLLDAAACSWTAARLLSGAARCFPARVDRDARGLRMAIWC